MIQDKINKLTALLCETCRMLDSFSDDQDIPCIDWVPGLAEWWKEHQKLDKKHNKRGPKKFPFK